MVAVDTDVLVRLLTNDQAAQAARAVAIFRAGPVFVAKTVLLETEWVLRHAYRLTSGAIARSFLALAGLPTATLEDAVAVQVAIGMMERGMDFANALHLASSRAAERFVTFDTRLVKRARKDTPVPVVLA